jgi:hypothetical protein
LYLKTSKDEVKNGIPIMEWMTTMQYATLGITRLPTPKPFNWSTIKLYYFILTYHNARQV